MKRFTATEKWMNQWFQELSPPMKCFWFYLCDQCDAAGVWAPNFPLASYIIRSKVTKASLAEFGGRVVELRSGKIWIEAFVSFQYSKLTRACRPHWKVLELLKKHGIAYHDDQCSIGEVTSKDIPALPDRVSDRVSHTLKEEEEKKEEEGVQGEMAKTGSERTPFSQFWEAYPKKVAKGFAEKASKKANCASLLPQILEAVDRAKATEAWVKEYGQFIPHPATWLNGRCWEDELPAASACSDGAARARVNPHRLREGFLPESAFTDTTRVAGEIANSKLFIVDAVAATIGALRARVRRLHRKHGLAAIFVDYLQLLRSRSVQAVRSSEREISEISQGLKSLGKELNLPVVVLSQLNRNPESRTGSDKGRPMLSDLRESGSIEQDADFVGLLVREEYYATTEEQRIEMEGKATLIIAKQRNGPVGDVRLTFLKEFTRFEDRARAEEPSHA
jgi:DnaB-like helicase C terminal domain